MAKLIEEPDGSGDVGAREWKRPGRWTVVGLVTATVLLLAARHDYWNWETARPLLFEIVPVGLWWQALVSVGAAGLLWLMVRYAWPGWIEEEVAEGEKGRGREGAVREE